MKKKIASILDKTSGPLGFGGFVFSKLKLIFSFTPIALLVTTTNYIGLSLMMAGNFCWYLACMLHPDKHSKKPAWYRFTSFNNQFKLAAIINLVATYYCFVIPSLTIPIACLYAIGSMVWWIGEYHKYQRIKEKHPEKALEQLHYVKYASLMTAIAITSSLFVAIAVILPSIALLATIVSTAVGAIMGGFAIYHWKKSWPEKKSETSEPQPDTYQKLNETMHPGDKPLETPDASARYEHPLDSQNPTNKCTIPTQADWRPY